MHIVDKLLQAFVDVPKDPCQLDDLDSDRHTVHHGMRIFVSLESGLWILISGGLGSSHFLRDLEKRSCLGAGSNYRCGRVNNQIQESRRVNEIKKMTKLGVVAVRAAIAKGRSRKGTRRKRRLAHLTHWNTGHAATTSRRHHLYTPSAAGSRRGSTEAVVRCTSFRQRATSADPSASSLATFSLAETGETGHLPIVRSAPSRTRLQGP
ncbi:hypothetical protein K461DRAFT_140717 [Myriangium duriaei CBS 260.36]|uniref:Uncharacterized protein n=1 Tax=Myriangium duriaei CBS 260.36 TaxID=1168546 RepID=A0A9P4J0Z3_9PEZI|nr:hypothetical protein K461DRAFT_140717 [Myriangium duriaei CBS 260.36]